MPAQESANDLADKLIAQVLTKAPANPPAGTAASLGSAVAPPREKRLVPVPISLPVPPARRPAAKSGPQPARKPSISAVENKVAALKDPDEILLVLQTEAALRRAQRLSGVGESQRQTMRLLSVFMLFSLLIAAIGAMWYLQTLLQGSHHKERVSAKSAATTRP